MAGVGAGAVFARGEYVLDSLRFLFLGRLLDAYHLPLKRKFKKAHP